MRRYIVLFSVDVLEVDGTAHPVPLTRPRTGIYSWGTDPDDALARAEDALSSLIDAERAGDILRKP